MGKLGRENGRYIRIRVIDKVIKGGKGNMERKELIYFIEELARNLSFEDASKKIEEKVYDFPSEVYINQLTVAGIIPEIYPHDSSVEKLYAKYLDSLLSRFFREFGFNSEVLKERSEAPDVLVYNENKQVIIAGDAKGFRLSRTAKNQKDFKVDSLRSWADKYGASYACLLAPLFQYPPRESQIYSQAITRRVVLISFEDCALLLKNKGCISPLKLLELFEYSDFPEFERNFIKKDESIKTKPSNLRKKVKFYRAFILDKILNISSITSDEYKKEMEVITSNMKKEIELQLKLLRYEKQPLIDNLSKLVQMLKAEDKLREMLEKNSY